MTYPEKALVWIDVETTGLIAHREHLLEVACLVTDLDLNLLDEDGFQSVIADSRDLRSAAVPFVQEMHDKTGLWAKVRDPYSPLRHDVEADLLAYIQRFVPEPRTARLAGNSVRLDLNFLDEHMPSVTNHLHYRMLDVSTVAGLAQWWAGIESYPKQRNHSAMADIRESIAELRYLRENFIPAGGTR